MVARLISRSTFSFARVTQRPKGKGLTRIVFQKTPSVHASYGIAVTRRYEADVSALHENQRRGLG